MSREFELKSKHKLFTAVIVFLMQRIGKKTNKDKKTKDNLVKRRLYVTTKPAPLPHPNYINYWINFIPQKSQ